MDLARAPRRAARKKGSGYENEFGHFVTLVPSPLINFGMANSLTMHGFGEY